MSKVFDVDFFISSPEQSFKVDIIYILQKRKLKLTEAK